MGTRGLFGFRKNGKDKAMYNHYDSYPDWLGKEFLKFILLNKTKLSGLYDRMIDVNGTKPTKEQQKYCSEMGWYNGSVSTGRKDDWYCLLHGLQSLDQWQKATDTEGDVFFENQISFIKDSLYCEYAYIYDIDTNNLELYVGFQKEPDETNRYGTDCTPGYSDDYYPCKLVYTKSIDENTVITDVVRDMNTAAN